MSSSLRLGASLGIRDRLARFIGREERFNLGQYPQFLQDYYSQFGYAGSLYPLGLNQTAMSWSKTEEISASLPNYMIALRRSPPAFAAQMVRALVLSQARLVWRNRVDRHVFRNADLRLLERPWPNGTTGELLSRMEWSAGLAGNAYIYRQSATRLRVLRPDWVKIVYGSNEEPDDPKGALDAEVLGYAYMNGGFTQQNKNPVQVLLPEEVAHWTPLPDPMSPGLGMSWITPALRELQADQAAEEYKLAFFSNGATPNLVVKAGDPKFTDSQFKTWVDTMESTHKGAVNAFKTLYLTSGADATVIGSNLQQLDLSSITSHSETRISYLSRVPAVILGIAAGLKGSSLNAGNYGEARRNFADSWYYSTLQDACASLGAIVNVPGGSELWYDVADVPLLREDAADAANIEQTKATTINSYVMSGFTPESAVQAVVAQDVNLLVHTNLFSVQLQPPMPNGPPDAASAGPESPQPTPDAPPARSLEPAPPTIQNFYVKVEREIPADIHNHFEFEVAAPSVTLEQPINVQAAAPAEVTIPVTVNPAQVTLEQPITVEAAAPAQIHNEFAAPIITVDSPVTVEQPEITVNVPEPTRAAPRTKRIRVKRADGSEATATIEESE